MFVYFHRGRSERMEPQPLTLDYQSLFAGKGTFFTENFAGKIGCRFVDGRFREIRLSDPKSGPTDIALAADDSAWFVERDSNRLGLLSKNFQLREFSVSRADGKLFWLSDLAVDTAGNAWVIKNPAEVEEGRMMPSFRDAGGRIIMVDRHGRVREYPVGLVNGITRGPDGRIWFTRHASFGRIGPDGTITTFSSPKEGLGFILAAPDGNLWFVVGLPAPLAMAMARHREVCLTVTRSAHRLSPWLSAWRRTFQFVTGRLANSGSVQVAARASLTRDA